MSEDRQPSFEQETCFRTDSRPDISKSLQVRSLFVCFVFFVVKVVLALDSSFHLRRSASPADNSDLFGPLRGAGGPTRRRKHRS